jgi:hypothetical protein
MTSRVIEIIDFGNLYCMRFDDMDYNCLLELYMLQSTVTVSFDHAIT